jgi:uncharacterized protein YbjT (DUF2867 family)
MESARSKEPLTIAIAGATGFVGEALCRAFTPEHRVVGLTRSRERAERTGRDEVTWRQCDLFSLRDLERALEGADCAIYLVHSMLPSARLTQASFADLDLLLADNFARAAKRCGVSQILYVGGLTPSEGSLSPHLASRLEVERTLASHGVPLTALRAGLIVGPGGSSLSILVNLVRRLPAMILPRWTRSRTQPIALADVVRAAHHCVGNPETYARSFDIGGPDVMTYRAMLAQVAESLKKRRFMIGVPLFSPRLSRLWVTLFSGASGALVNPLIETLRHDMVCADNPLQRRLAPEAQGFTAALEQSLASGDLAPKPRHRLFRLELTSLRRESTVRSVQRLVLPKGRDARWVAAEYLRFLPRFVAPLVGCRIEGDLCRLTLRGTPLLLMEMRFAPDRSAGDRQIFDVVGGLLVRRGEGSRGRLEFREVLDRRHVLAAVHDFQPALPWLIYNQTHARVHLWVMRGFSRHLRRMAEGSAPAIPASASDWEPE